MSVIKEPPGPVFSKEKSESKNLRFWFFENINSQKNPQFQFFFKPQRTNFSHEIPG
jgi:hypothetical protein